MATDFGQWDRVASELKACREAQQQAWGDVDNATLGRYLAGDVTPEERRRIENELQQRPELRKLTDLVSNVLRDCEPVAGPESARPSVLSFSAKRHTSPVARRWRQWAAVAAAACLLLALGYTVLPHGSGPSAAVPHGSLAVVTTSGFPTSPVASKSEPGPHGLAPGRPPQAFAKVAASKSATPLDHVAVYFADGCAQAADSYQRHGDLDLAEFSYKLAYNVREWKLGPDAEPTVRTRRSLGRVYQTALAMNGSAPFTAVRTMPPAPLAVPDKRPEQEVEASAAQLCERLAHQPVGEVRRSVAPVLVAKLNEATTPEDREQLGRALAALGPAARDAVPALEDCLKNNNLTPPERAAVLRAKELLVRSEAPFGVRDGCELFSLAGLEQGQEAILSLAKTDQVEVLAETRPLSRTEADDGKDRDRPIEGNRLYLVIHPSPVSVDVYVGAGLRGRGFDQERQARLRQVVEEAAARRTSTTACWRASAS